MRTLKGTFFLLSLLALAAASVQPGGSAVSNDGGRAPAERVAAAARGEGTIVDLTHALNDHSPAWPGDVEPFKARVNASVEEQGYFTRKFCMLEHYGTHMDAPLHFPPGKTSVDAIAVERFFGPAVLVDIRKPAANDSDYALSPADLAAWEERHGPIPAGAIVLARTGWVERWPDQQRYRNLDAEGVMHFPGYSVEAVQLLLERGVSGLGIDTLSVDPGAAKKVPVHRLSHGADLYHLENLADLSVLPESGAFLVVAPIKLEGGSGGPVRVFALLPPE